MTDLTKTTVTTGSIFKTLGIVLPIIITILYGYVNIMTKLTQLEMSINENNKSHIEFAKDIEELKETDERLFDLIDNHVISDDLHVKQQRMKLKDNK